jgi:uncharacterized protein YdaU (DUF1376 family)
VRHFPHHIGDYAAATAHLSFVEDAAYHRLLRLYYRDEKPLPADVAACQRLVGARAEEERAAVEVVLREFFKLDGDGWHQTRADAELVAYRHRAETARQNGTKSGGRPKPKDKPSGNQVGSSPDTQKEPSAKLTISQEPVTSPVVANAPTGAAAPEPEDDLEIPGFLKRKGMGVEKPAREVIYAESLPWLMRRTGKSRDACARMIGQWLRDEQDNADVVLAALRTAQEVDAADPFPFVKARLPSHTVSARETADQRRIREGTAVIEGYAHDRH